MCLLLLGSNAGCACRGDGSIEVDINRTLLSACAEGDRWVWLMAGGELICSQIATSTTNGCTEQRRRSEQRTVRDNLLLMILWQPELDRCSGVAC